MADYTTASFAPVFIDHTSKVSSTLFSSNPLSFLHEIHMLQQHSLANNLKDGVFESRNVEVDATAASSVLHVTIHQAKDIQNICIYGNQDVYAKLFITHRQDAVYSTRPVKSGGKNPIFNQTLEIPVCGWDAVLKCELWMMSCAQNYLQDQLLGFALVPLKSLYGKGKQTQEYCLTSTDLFYTPAGMLQLSLTIYEHDNVSMSSNMSMVAASEGESSSCPPTPNAHEVMMGYDGKTIPTSNLCKIEFLDLEAASEDQQLVSMYYKMAASASLKEYESNAMILQDARGCECSENGNGTGHNADQAESEKVEADKGLSDVDSIGVVENELIMEDKFPSQNETNEMSTTTTAVASPTIKALKAMDTKPATSSSSVESQSLPASTDTQDKAGKCKGNEAAASLPLITTPLVNISIEPEMSINQEHFVDLYLKSMQQFTEKLAEMKFSLDMDAQQDSAVLTRNMQGDKKDAGKKGPKLYYGSRAFY